MNKMIRLLAVLTALMLLLGAAAAQTTEDAVIATVNGEALLQSEYAATEKVYIASYTNAGYDLSDETLLAYVQDLALSVAIENMLIEQDMKAQGCYDFDEETEKWFVEQGNAAYEAALLDAGEMFRTLLDLDEDADVSEYALDYAESLGATPESYAEVYRTQYAMVKYYEWLNGGETVSQSEIQTAYDARVADSRALYENDAAAFETALNDGSAVWYKPEGYRSVLQILLPAEGKNDAEKLASVKKTVDTINARIKDGADYKALISEFGTDAAFEDESFYSVGYQVHKDSIIWEKVFVEAAFSQEMKQPGCWSKPFASELGVHILYYLADSEGGAVEMTQQISDALSYEIYSQRSQERLSARLDELADAAEVVTY